MKRKRFLRSFAERAGNGGGTGATLSVVNHILLGNRLRLRPVLLSPFGGLVVL